jgi:hypothetical protein
VHDAHPQKWKEAARLYEQAIALDSSFALARAGLASSFFLLGYFGVEPQEEVWPKAREAAQQAIELDADAAEAYTALGYILLFADWDWSGTETALVHALRLDPNDAFARHGMADLLTIRGRPEEGLRQAELGRQADPLSSLVNGTVVGHLYLARHFEGAIAEIHRLREEFHNPHFLQSFLVASLWQLHRYEEAWPEYRTYWSRINDPGILPAADRGYAEGGPRGAMRAVADYGAQHWNARSDASSIAKYYARADARDLSLQWLERARRERVSNLPIELADPVFDAMRLDPRFQALVRGIGLSSESR